MSQITCYFQNSLLDFGKYENCTIEAVRKANKNYYDWLCKQSFVKILEERNEAIREEDFPEDYNWCLVSSVKLKLWSSGANMKPENPDKYVDFS